jgi:hypothetical protein
MDPISLLGLAPNIISTIAKAFGIDMTSEETKAKALDAQVQIQQMIMDSANAQAQTNTAEAASDDKFTSRWRPAVGWICAIAMGYHAIIQPLCFFWLTVAGVKMALPVVDMNMIMPVLLGMLGLGGLRTYEKVQGVNRKR